MATVLEGEMMEEGRHAGLLLIAVQSKGNWMGIV